MKKILFLLILISLISCKEKHPSNYTTISGLIENNNANYITLSANGLSKELSVAADGTFKDTIVVEKPSYFSLISGRNRALVYIENGCDIEVFFDNNKFDKSLTFSGQGSETSAYLIAKKKYDTKENLRNKQKYYALNKTDFNAKMNEIENAYNKMLSSDKIDPTLKANEIKKNKSALAYLKKNYAKNHTVASKLLKGSKSPVFIDYETIDGTKVSLDDFEGKFVYIDVWATWCGPCKRETEPMKRIEEKYKNKNIAFVGISVDGARRHGSMENAKKKWKEMVIAKKMAGTQLFADKAWASDFIRSYGIRSIPRFLLIDPNGKIVSSNAPRPSQVRLIEFFNAAGI